MPSQPSSINFAAHFLYSNQKVVWTSSTQRPSSRMYSARGSILSDSLWLHGLYCPWNSPGKNTGVGCYFLLQGIFLTQGWNPGLPHCRQILYCLSHPVSQSVSSVAQTCPTLCDPMNCSTPGLLSITNSQSSPKLTPTELVMPSSHLILCHPLLLLLSIPPSIRVFSNESTLRMKWPKYWSFSFSISPSNEHPGLISFKMDWLDLLAVQGTLNSLLQHHSSKTSVLRCSAFFVVQLSHPNMTTGKTTALTKDGTNF